MSYFDQEIYEHERKGYEIWKRDQDEKKQEQEQEKQKVEYEVIVFEYQDIYATAMIPKENLVEEFTNMCVEYVSPEYIPQSETCLNYGKTFVSYSDRSGGDKPMIVLLTGVTVDSDLISPIKESLRKKYLGVCEDCGVEVEMKWALCIECRQK
jgi:hypothetical protein